MAKRTIRVAYWHYRDADGKRRRAWFGDEVDLSKDEVERGDKAGVFTAPTPTVRTPDPLEVVLAGGDPNAPIPGETVADEPVPTPIPDATPDAVSDADAADQPADGAAEAVPERPVKTAHVDKWEAFVVAATAKSDRPITPEQAKSMTKEELQAVVPAPKDG